ncbi:Hypothetical_protein [Hexamita inflata]|uniref:Hypothetical_protein n=1 Tax=Hexamita inflata TaxID=28002 RepID=A0AA86NAQ8_9EUKA|nr:Hypothetical protein HINF_LOCUS3396 [Hexamita inflata]
MFIVTQNNQYLELTWIENLDAQTIDYQILSDQYDNIIVKGKNNCVFQEFQLLNRTQSFSIYNCQLDLNRINTSLDNIVLDNCICQNEFKPEISIGSLMISDSQIKTNQLQNSQLELLDVSITSDQHFDFYNCHQLKCTCENLFLSNQNVDLSCLVGNWNSINFSNCELTNQFGDQLFANSVDIELETEFVNLYEPLLSGFDHLNCHELSIQITQTYLKDSNVILELVNNIQLIDRIQIQLTNQRVDLNKTIGKWDEISFTNCILYGDSETYKNIYAKSNIFIEMSEMRIQRQYDISALYGIQTILHISINTGYDLSNIYKCTPKELYLENMLINLEQLKGIWNTLQFIQCEFDNLQDFDQTNIMAQQVIIFKCNYQVVKFLDSPIMNINDTQITGILPQSKQLTIKGGSVSINTQNQTIQQLTIKNCKLIRFSILLLPNLVSYEGDQGQKIITDYLKSKKTKIKKLEVLKKNLNNLENRKLTKLLHVKNLQSTTPKINNIIFNNTFKLYQ